MRTGTARAAIIRTVLPLLLALSGCHLVDQTDFYRKPPGPPPPPPVPSPETRTALVTIDYGKPNPDYRAAVATAVQAVEARRPNSLYDVVAVVGTTAGAKEGQTRAADVMTAIEAGGVIPARIQLGVTVDPGRKVPQVRIYLR